MRPPIFFSRVVAAFATAVGRLDRLAIQDGRGWPGLAALDAAAFGAEGVVDPLPGSVGLPAAEVGVDRLPGREVVGQQPPGTAGAAEVEDSRDQVAVAILAGAAAGFGCRHQVLDVVPLQVRQVGWVGLPCHAQYLNRPQRERKEGFLNTLLARRSED